MIALVFLLLLSPSINAFSLKSMETNSQMMSNSVVPRIAIIGGGAAGLAAARVLQRDSSASFCVFEKESHIGGVWKYKKGSVDSPMYRGLRTNLPKEVMAFREFPWIDVEESFVTHYDVVDYLRNYSSKFGLQRFVKEGHCVKQLTCLLGSKSLCSPDEEAWPKIQLEVETAESDTLLTEVFDAVLICNGHYSLPRVPKIPGLQFFKGKVAHSIEYDEPKASGISGASVLCVGGRASGSDIARELSLVPGLTVFLSDSTFKGAAPITESNVTWLPRFTEVLPDGRLQFDQTTAVMEPLRVETIVFCSGYDYSFPFVNARSNLALNSSDRRVTPLFEQLWHASFPTIAFSGLPHSVVPFPLFELQAEAVVRSWRDSGVLPSLRDRTEHSDAAAASGGEGKTNGNVPGDTHYLGSAQWDYCRRMAKYACILDETVADYLKINKSIYDHISTKRKGAFPAGPDLYRSIRYSRGRQSFSASNPSAP